MSSIGKNEINLGNNSLLNLTKDLYLDLEKIKNENIHINKEYDNLQKFSNNLIENKEVLLKQIAVKKSFFNQLKRKTDIKRQFLTDIVNKSKTLELNNHSKENIIGKIDQLRTISDNDEKTELFKRIDDNYKNIKNPLLSILNFKYF